VRVTPADLEPRRFACVRARFNPGIASASKIEDIDSTTSIWLGRTAPMKFGSGVEVTSVMKFRITFVPPLMNLEVLETSTESTGPRIFTRMIDAILPKVSSRTSVRLDGDQLTSDAHLELELPLPGWLPLPRSSIEKLGPPILEKQLGGDLVALLDRYAAAYAAGRGDLGLESGLGR
jgi:hypothetical protein